MRIRTLLLSTAIVIACQSCIKAVVNDHDTLLGTWHIKKITALDGVTNTAALDFGTGDYTFNADGSLEYLNGVGILHKGNWLLYGMPDKSDTDANGNTITISGGTALDLEADPTTGTPKKKKAHFEYFTIIDNNNFAARLSPNGVATHEYSFVRKL